MALQLQELLHFYKMTLTEDFIPFWDKAFDQEHGG